MQCPLTNRNIRIAWRNGINQYRCSRKYGKRRLQRTIIFRVYCKTFHISKTGNLFSTERNYPIVSTCRIRILAFYLALIF